VVFRLQRLVLRCSVCGLVFSSRDDLQSTGDAYSEAYFREGVYADYLGDRSAIERTASARLAELARLTNGRSLLEIGCAAGYFLGIARDSGWDVHGLELSPHMSLYARTELQLDVATGSIEMPPSGMTPVDVVALWDTIEHLSHPFRALANIRTLLLPGGVLALSTGDHGSILRRVTGRSWRLFSDPTHNFFFDETTLRRLLSESGFDIIGLSRRGKWVSLSMVLHQSGLPFATKVRRALQTRGWNPAVYVNLRDVVTVYARPIR
jgi:2-polyprenyl-3-methyl-5-hydroxy-6-metoxy-1,4-benzoquinol methylase